MAGADNQALGTLIYADYIDEIFGCPNGTHSIKSNGHLTAATGCH